MKVCLSGREQKINPPITTIYELLKQLGHEDNSGIALAVNGCIIPRLEYEKITLHVDDEIEIIRAVQGG